MVMRTTSMRNRAHAAARRGRFSLLYHHPTLAPRLDGRQFSYLTV
jgi:hypothetical protein